MTRLIFGLILIATIGCTGIQPVGPLAKRGLLPGGDPKPTEKDAPLSTDPVTIPAPKPIPPTKQVDPDEVNAENAYLMLQKLATEIETDRKNMPAARVTVETSVYKGGVKQDN